MRIEPVFLRAPLALDPVADAAAGKSQRFQGVAYSGGRVPGWGGGLVIDLASLQADAPLPLLHIHDHTAIIGSVQSVANDGCQIMDMGELFVDIDEEAKGISLRAAKGIPYQQSLGVYFYNEEEVPAGKTAQVNGQTFHGPIRILRDALLREISICPLGADSDTSAAFLAAHKEDLLMPPENVTELTAKVASQATELATLTAELNGYKQKVPDLQRQLDDANAQVVTLTAERDTLQAKQKALHEAAVKSLFSALGKEYKEEAAAPYLAMDAATFETVAAELRAARKAPDGSLFQELAQGDPAPGGTAPSLNMADIYAKRRPASH